MTEKKELSRKEFDILVSLALENRAMTRAEIREKSGVSLSTIGRALAGFEAEGLVRDGKITAKGKAALRPYEAKRAVFIAAGFGSRLAPVTLNTPKPLVRVRGKRIIDTAIDACVAAGIREIYIVRGYLAEQFDQLQLKYPGMIHFIENPKYNDSNNIGSIRLARHLLQNAYVFEADLLVSNPAVIKKYHYQSDYLSFYVERSDDCCFRRKNGMISEMFFGGEDCYQQIGISYWNREDGKKLQRDIERLWHMPGGKEHYWEYVPLEAFKSDYRVELIVCAKGDVTEIDTFRELVELDRSYAVN